MSSPHGSCTIELMERHGDVGEFECGECGQQYTLPVNEDGEPMETDPDPGAPQARSIPDDRDVRNMR